MDKMPERIWVWILRGTIKARVNKLEAEMQSIIDKMAFSGDNKYPASYLRSTPTLEHAGEMKKLVNSQRLIINRLSSLLSYHADVKITDEKDYMSRFVPVEITILKRAKKRSAEVKNLLTTITTEEAEGMGGKG